MTGDRAAFDNMAWWRPWWMAARPRTLPASLAPVLMGAALAHGDGAFHGLSVIVALMGAVLIQIGTNLANDYFDFVQGADTDRRKGPVRVTQAGLIPPATVRRAAILVFALVALPAAYAAWRGGSVFVLIAVLSVVFGVLYTGGPYPLGYMGLGDILVLLFFGPVAVGGVYYLQTLTLTPEAVVAGIGVGSLAVGLLAVNNLRDVEEDRAAGKRTLAVRFGPGFARIEYVACVVISSLAVPLYFYGATGSRWFLLVALIGLCGGMPAAMVMHQRNDAGSLNQVLARTGKLLIVYGAAFSLAYIL